MSELLPGEEGEEGQRGGAEDDGLAPGATKQSADSNAGYDGDAEDAEKNRAAGEKTAGDGAERFAGGLQVAVGDEECGESDGAEGNFGEDIAAIEQQHGMQGAEGGEEDCFGQAEIFESGEEQKNENDEDAAEDCVDAKGGGDVGGEGGMLLPDVGEDERKADRVFGGGGISGNVGKNVALVVGQGFGGTEVDGVVFGEAEEIGGMQVDEGDDVEGEDDGESEPGPSGAILHLEEAPV